MSCVSTKAHLDSRRDEAFAQLLELLRIPSVSTASEHREDVARCARWVEEHLTRADLETELIQTPGHPIIFGQKIVDPNLPTVMVYGHYDVQPPEPLDEWRHGPFDPTVEGEYVYARGASDDKGQVYALVKGIESYIKTRKKGAVNVKVLIEGEEEIGSVNLENFVRKETNRLACDVVVIADNAQFAKDVPAITYGLKGICYVEVVVRGANQDLHSGTFGGAVANPANVLARLISACQKPFGKVAIPGFYNDVVDIEPWEREAFAKLPFDDTKFREELGVPQLFGEEGYTTLERKWARPTFDVNGLVSGFTDEGAKTVLPGEARAKFSMRLVPDQDPDKIRRQTYEFLEEIAPVGVSLQFIEHHGARPVVVRRDGAAVRAAVAAFETGFGREPVFIREGGSIPVVNTFQEALDVECLLMGLGLPDDNLHAPNERFRIEDYHRGAVTMAAFLEQMGEANR